MCKQVGKLSEVICPATRTQLHPLSHCLRMEIAETHTASLTCHVLHTYARSAGNGVKTTADWLRDLENILHKSCP